MIKVPLSKDFPFVEKGFSEKRGTILFFNKSPKKVASSKLFHLEMYAYAFLSTEFIAFFVDDLLKNLLYFYLQQL